MSASVAERPGAPVRHPVSAAVGRQVRSVLIEQHRSARSLAAAVGMSPGYLQRRLDGQQSLTVAELVAVCAALDVSLVEFFREALKDRPVSL